jgi:hypothetical protein
LAQASRTSEGGKGLRGSSVEDALKMQTPAPDDAIVIRPEEKKAA